MRLTHTYRKNQDVEIFTQYTNDFISYVPWRVGTEHFIDISVTYIYISLSRVDHHHKRKA